MFRRKHHKLKQFDCNFILFSDSSRTKIQLFFTWKRKERKWNVFCSRKMLMNDCRDFDRNAFSIINFEGKNIREGGASAMMMLVRKFLDKGFNVNLTSRNVVETLHNCWCFRAIGATLNEFWGSFFPTQIF